MKFNSRLSSPRFLTAVALVFLLSGCLGQESTPIRPAPPLALPTATSLPSPTPTLAPTSTPQPTATVTPPSKPTALAPFDLPKGPDLLFTGKNTEMKIFWQGEPGQTYRLEWGADASYSLGSLDASPSDPPNNLYASLISGLQPGTRYLYRVVSGGKASGGSFFTAPPADAPILKFVVYGDTRTHPDLHDAVAAQVVSLFRSDPAYQAFNPMLGDFVNYGDDPASWMDELFSPAFKNIRAELANLAVVPVMGNHEGSGVLFTRYFPMPFVASRYWSFDYGPAHVALLDQYVDYAKGSPQYEWLKADLAASAKPWKFVVLHEPGWSAGGAHENNLTVQNDIQPLLKQSGVSVLFAGHNHYYARAEVDGIQHLTVGTGGAPLYTPVPGYPHILFTYSGTGYERIEIAGSTLTGSFVDSAGKILDTFTLQK